MKVFVDTNVVLDYLTGREPFVDDAELVVEFCTREVNEGVITTLSAWNIVYVLARIIGRRQAEQRLSELLDMIGLVGVEPESVLSNIGLEHVDFEDSIQMSEAVRWGADVIVTRDKHGFANSPIPVMTSSEFIDQFG